MRDELEEINFWESPKKREFKYNMYNLSATALNTLDRLAQMFGINVTEANKRGLGWTASELNKRVNEAFVKHEATLNSEASQLADQLTALMTGAVPANIRNMFAKARDRVRAAQKENSLNQAKLNVSKTRALNLADDLANYNVGDRLVNPNTGMSTVDKKAKEFDDVINKENAYNKIDPVKVDPNSIETKIEGGK